MTSLTAIGTPASGRGSPRRAPLVVARAVASAPRHRRGGRRAPARRRPRSGRGGPRVTSTEEIVLLASASASSGRGGASQVGSHVSCLHLSVTPGSSGVHVSMPLSRLGGIRAVGRWAQPSLTDARTCQSSSRMRGTAKRPSSCSGRTRQRLLGGEPGRTTSGRVTLVSGIGCDIGGGALDGRLLDLGDRLEDDRARRPCGRARRPRGRCEPARRGGRRRHGRVWTWGPVYGPGGAPDRASGPAGGGTVR